MDLKGKRAIVTGGTRGIGRAIVLELAKHGCNVLFTYRKSGNESKDLEREVKNYGVNVFSMQADAASYKDAEKVAKAAIEKLGGIDILVNNAGMTKDNLLLRMSESDFDDVIDTNLKSVYNYTKVCIQPMMRQSFGRIINITSVVGLFGNPGQANYCASKAGVIGFTKSVAKELASRNITANCIAPGYIVTDMTEALPDKVKEDILNKVPLKRPGKPSDVAKAVVFLCSEYADYITGQTIAVDGGMSM